MGQANILEFLEKQPDKWFTSKQIAEEARCRTIDELLVVLEKEIPEQQMLLGRLKRKFWKYQTRVSSQE